MHDSRGAAVKVGDRVFIEAEIVNLATGGDQNYCVVDVQIVTPNQIDREKVMSPPKVSCLSTKMLTKVGAALLVLIAFAFPAFAQPYTQAKQTPVTLFGRAEQQQILQLQKQLADSQAAQIANQNQLIMFLLQQQQQRQAAPQAPQPINIYLPPGYQGPKIDPNPGTPKLDPSPGTPKIDPNPGTPKLDPAPGAPKLDPTPGTPKLDLTPGAPPKLNLNPGTPAPPGPPVGYQRFSSAPSGPPIIRATITDANGVTRPVPMTAWRPVN